jgi:hypothetical protein
MQQSHVQNHKTGNESTCTKIRFINIECIWQYTLKRLTHSAEYKVDKTTDACVKDVNHLCSSQKKMSFKKCQIAWDYFVAVMTIHISLYSSRHFHVLFHDAKLLIFLKGIVIFNSLHSLTIHHTNNYTSIYERISEPLSCKKVSSSSGTRFDVEHNGFCASSSSDT